MAKTPTLKPEELFARSYADRLILGQLLDLREVVRLSELAERLQARGLGLAAVRSLLASNPEKFAYAERRWVPAARLQSEGRPFWESLRLAVDRFGGPMPIELLARECCADWEDDELAAVERVRRIARSDDTFVLTHADEVALSRWVFVAHDETPERAFALNGVDPQEVEELRRALGEVNWLQAGAIRSAVEKVAPVSVKALGAVAWMALNPPDPRALLLFDWRSFAAEALSVPGFVYASDGKLYPESESRKWISVAVKLADRLAPSIEIEEAAPIEVKPGDLDRMVERILASETSVTARTLLEEFFEVTPSVKTFDHDLNSVLEALKTRPEVWWVGADRFRRPNSAPEFIYEIPEPFKFVQTEFRDAEGELVDVELSDEGLPTSLRKLLSHPLATDVLDEDIAPPPKNLAEQLRLVLKPIHRELGTFPLCQFPTGWIPAEPKIQELVFVNPEGQELEVWANMELRLLFGLFDWFIEQPIESGAVFSLTRTARPNVFEFQWLDQPDPVVFISSQRMEELRNIQARSDEMSTYEILREIMGHWPKGADYLTLLWEINVVRRTSRRLLASLLSGYLCFYQRSGSPVWHYDPKKVDLGFDRTKTKFIRR